jgi:hypothetical protein
VRRRYAHTSGAVPDRLAAFVLEDWPGGISGAFAVWCEARRVWAEAHGWPGGGDRRSAEQIEAASRLPDEEWTHATP